jgi:hypothetical protein
LQGSWSNHYNKKREKIKEKGTPPWYVKVGGNSKDSVSHGLRKEKWGGVPNYKRAYKCLLQHFGTALTCLVWKIARTLLRVVDRNNHLSKQFYLYFTNEKL